MQTFIRWIVRKLLGLGIVLVVTLGARENPFFPAEGVQELPVSANIVKEYPPLKRAALTFPNSARIIKEVAVTYQNLDGSIDTKSITLDQSIDWHLPLFVSQSYSANEAPKTPKSNQSAAKELFKNDWIRFSHLDKEIHINTSDMMIRHFMLIRPYRVVLDFKRDSSFKTVSKEIDATPFTKITLGNHGNYYRAVIELDGQYHTSVNNDNGQITVSCF